MIPGYPETAEVTLDMKQELGPLLKKYNEGISEYTFAGLYLFRETHHYRIGRLSEECVVLTGNDRGKAFFMLPTELPPREILDTLFASHSELKGITESKSQVLAQMDYRIAEDRDNFDYLYLRQDLAKLPGKKFHKKRTFVSGFMKTYAHESKPLLRDTIPVAQAVLEEWHTIQGEDGDLAATKEALLHFEELGLCGAVYWVSGKPAAFVIGEPLLENNSYVIHFEKALTSFRGIYQYINKAFASVIPKKYVYINREQDLGDEGLRQAKLTYRPCDFVKKYRASLPRN
ncbi:MAG: DUF2156 domain-containing protein [Spirochaetaceae bacterium]|nr:MAG: DUF2156 domain-containing protein [Spirochaetaceae bacterium]